MDKAGRNQCGAETHKFIATVGSYRKQYSRLGERWHTRGLTGISFNCIGSWPPLLRWSTLILTPVHNSKLFNTVSVFSDGKPLRNFIGKRFVDKLVLAKEGLEVLAGGITRLREGSCRPGVDNGYLEIVS